MAVKKIKVRFLETRIVEDTFEGTDKETKFEKGKAYTLPEASALRWIERGTAELDGKSKGNAGRPPEFDGDGSNVAEMGKRIAAAVKDKEDLAKQVEELTAKNDAAMAQVKVLVELAMDFEVSSKALSLLLENPSDEELFKSAAISPKLKSVAEAKSETDQADKVTVKK